MKFVAPLTADEQQQLARLMKTSGTFRVRQRAHAVLLSAKRYSIEQLADIFEVDRDTVSIWLDAWQQSALRGLEDAPKSGRPPKLTDKQMHMAIKQVEDSPQQITRTLGRLKKTGPYDQP